MTDSRSIHVSTNMTLSFFNIKVYCQLLSFQKVFILKHCFMMEGKDERERRRQVLLVPEHMRGLGFRADEGQQEERRRNVYFS